MTGERAPTVFVFNPFAECYLSEGKGFTPVTHQALLASELANLPQFLCEPGDIVLVEKSPSGSFLNSLKLAGFAVPEFAELKQGRIDPGSSLCLREIGRLQPWAWGPDSFELLAPLFGRVTAKAPTAGSYFNKNLAAIYSKAWSAGFLRKFLAHCRSRGGLEFWLCGEQEAGVVVDTFEEALAAIRAIRARGHHRVVIKQAHGLAGQSSIRLWEPEVSSAQRRWIGRALSKGRQAVVEPWLAREMDFSVQLQMGARKLRVCGYTGLVSDRRGQFVANWAEADHQIAVPRQIAAMFHLVPDSPQKLQTVYGELFDLLEYELQHAGFAGPVSIDAFVYREAEGACRLKPIVEINPRYTMGRLTVELMKHSCPGTCGFFRLVNRAQARGEGFVDLRAYARSLHERLPLVLEGEPARVRRGALCLNDASQAKAWLAIFEVRDGVAGDGHELAGN